MIDRFRNDEKRTWNQELLANSESCVMTHHWCVVTHSKGCHGSAGMPSFRHDGAFLASWRTTVQRLFSICVVTEETLRHDAIAPEVLGVLPSWRTMGCVMTDCTLILC